MAPPDLIWPKAIVFDLDGTLVDSAPDIAAAVNAGFGPLGIQPFDVEAVKPMIGGGAAVAIQRAARQLGMTLAGDVEAGVLARFLETYARASTEGRGLYPDAHMVLSGLTSRGHRLAICTNKADHITHITLEALGIAGYFKTVIAGRDDVPKKPDPEMVRRALFGLGASPGEAVMIGDSHADIDAARAAGLRAIAVSYGYSPKPAAELGADLVVGGLAEIPAALADLARAAAV